MAGPRDIDRIRVLTVGLAGLMDTVSDLIAAVEQPEHTDQRQRAVERARASLAETSRLMLRFDNGRVIDLDTQTETRGPRQLAPPGAPGPDGPGALGAPLDPAEVHR